MRLFCTELRKILISNHALFIMLAAVILQLAAGLIPKAYDHPYSIDVYTRYTEKFEGEYTPDKEHYLRCIYEEYSAIIDEYPLYRDEYLAGGISLEEFSDFTERNAIANAEISTIEYLLEKCEYLNSANGFQKEIFNDAHIIDFFEGIGFDIIMFAALLCVVIPVFDREYTGKSSALILTSRYGRTRLAMLKMLAAAVVVFVFSWCMSTVRLEAHIIKFGSDFFNMAVGNLMGYDGFGNLSVLGYYLSDTLIKAVCWVDCSIMVCLMSVICRNTSFSFIISFLIIAAPLLLNGLGSRNTGMYIFDTVNLMRLYPSTLNFGIFALASTAKSVAFGWFTLRLWGTRNKSRGI